MDSELEKKFSFPDSDRYLSNKKESENMPQPKPVVHITDALNITDKRDADGLRTIRTFQADIADAIKNDNVSMIKVALAEKKRQDTRGDFNDALDVKKKDSMFYIVSISVVLFIFAILGLFFFLSSNTDTGNVAQNGTANEPLIYTEYATVIDINNRDANDVERLIARIKEDKFDLGTMKEIVLTTGTSTATSRLNSETFLRFINQRANDSLIRALNPEFMLGAYSFSNPYDTFAIFKVNSYDNAFAGMLEWENTLDLDFGGILISKKLIIPAKDTKGTTTPTLAKKRVFVDRVVQNKDSRVLLDENGSVLMLYTFVDKNTLVLASSDKSLKEVLFRLTTGRIIR